MPGGFELIKLPTSTVNREKDAERQSSRRKRGRTRILPWLLGQVSEDAMPSGRRGFGAGGGLHPRRSPPQECVIPDITVGGESTTAGALRINASLAPLTLDRRLSGELADVTVRVRRKERDPRPLVSMLRRRLKDHGALNRIRQWRRYPFLSFLLIGTASVIDARATRVEIAYDHTT